MALAKAKYCICLLIFWAVKLQAFFFFIIISFYATKYLFRINLICIFAALYEKKYGSSGSLCNHSLWAKALSACHTRGLCTP
jgi:hypothetical protein